MLQLIGASAAAVRIAGGVVQKERFVRIGLDELFTVVGHLHVLRLLPGIFVSKK